MEINWGGGGLGELRSKFNLFPSDLGEEPEALKTIVSKHFFFFWVCSVESLFKMEIWKVFCEPRQNPQSFGSGYLNNAVPRPGLLPISPTWLPMSFPSSQIHNSQSRRQTFLRRHGFSLWNNSCHDPETSVEPPRVSCNVTLLCSLIKPKPGRRVTGFDCILLPGYCKLFH